MQIAGQRLNSQTLIDRQTDRQTEIETETKKAM